MKRTTLLLADENQNVLDEMVKSFTDEKFEIVGTTKSGEELIKLVNEKTPEVVIMDIVLQNCDGFTGGSFQDMTRIAGVDELVWTPLYAHNRENIINELNGLIERLSKYHAALVEENDEKLSGLLREGRLIREKIKKDHD